MSPPPQVQVFAVGLPAPGVPKDRRRYRVTWRLDGRGKARAERATSSTTNTRSASRDSSTAHRPRHDEHHRPARGRRASMILIGPLGSAAHRVIQLTGLASHFHRVDTAPPS